MSRHLLPVSRRRFLQSTTLGAAAAAAGALHAPAVLRAQGAAVKWSDVEYDPNDVAVKVRREMEAAFGRQNS